MTSGTARMTVGGGGHSRKLELLSVRRVRAHVHAYVDGRKLGNPKMVHAILTYF